MELAQKETLLFIIWLLYAKTGNNIALYRIDFLKDLLPEDKRNNIPVIKNFQNQENNNTQAIKKYQEFVKDIFCILNDLKFTFGCKLKFKTHSKFFDELNQGLSCDDFCIEGYNTFLEELNLSNNIESYFEHINNSQTYKEYKTKPNENNPIEEFSQGSIDKYLLHWCSCEISFDKEELKNELVVYTERFSKANIDGDYNNLKVHKKNFEKFLKNTTNKKAETNYIIFKFNDLWNYGQHFRMIEYFIDLVLTGELEILDVKNKNVFSEKSYEIVAIKRIQAELKESAENAKKILVYINAKNNIHSIIFNNIELCTSAYLGTKKSVKLGLFNMLIQNPKGVSIKELKKQNNINDISSPISKINGCIRNIAPDNHPLKNQQAKLIILEDDETYRINTAYHNIIETHNI
ncbi:MAG: hypothetical protein PHX18_05275 [Candidatus Gastranaerophilales bacterium]|nr:hypothetical protein [Candidatus Gastranaerophilales bacterium]